MNLADAEQQKTMQLATVRGDQPWICTVYFVCYEGNFYWLSFPERRHSRELEAHNKAAIAIAIKQDVPVIGIQAEGDVTVVEGVEEVEIVLQKYIKKYNQGKDFTRRLKAGTNQHVLYRFTPRRVVMFDELHRSGDPYKTIATQ